MTGRRAALVTGAARGLGLGIGTRLVQDGWAVALLDRDPEVLAAAAALGGPDRVLGLVGDVADEQSCRMAVQATVERFGGLHALVNNAGVGGPTSAVHETDPAQFRQVLEVNLVGPFLMSRAAVPELLRTDGAAGIVNVTSILGQRSEPGSGAYSASKAALNLLGQAMATELAPSGLRVNSVAPGNMLTAMHRDHLAWLAERTGTGVEQATEAVRASVPLGRHGTPADVGAAVCWLLGDDAGYVTGHTLCVNGGVVLT